MTDPGDITAARYLCLIVPAIVALARWRPGRDGAAALLAFVAAAVGIAALGEVARFAGWYGFAAVDGAFRGLPVDLWLGWAALWGAIPVLYRRFLPLPLALGLLLWLDAVAMPALDPLVRLGPHWLIGETVGLLFVALPAQLLGRWTADRRHLGARTVLQVAVFAAVTLWLVPSVAFEMGDGSWAHLTGLPRPALLVLAQVGLLVAAPALMAVREFAVRGGGTPYPWDPPVRLVTTGPYAYVANPMQLSAVALLVLLAAGTRSATLGAPARPPAAFGAGVARPPETHDLEGRHGERWREYRRSVRDWRPRLTPYRAGPPAVLWLDEGCEACRGVWRFFSRRRSRGLTLAPAHEHQSPLRRSLYADGGHEERGVAAVARALEHLHLGWATVGWLLRLPGAGWLAQLVTDAMIAAPHVATAGNSARGSGCRTTPSSGCSTAR
ncbi:isoprenylcysteine carboxylmethyltransferase family protein [Micromonospora sp. CPCC 205371]|nr:isoprenylcysteine carboxylmethyltransferase family protein [Micromonospora sp. CPCC 205371]